MRGVEGPAVIGAHTTGRVLTPVGVGLTFVVTSYDEGRSWGWEVAGVRATHHLVEPAGGGATVTFGAPWWAPWYLPVLEVALRRLAHLAPSLEADRRRHRSAGTT